MIGDAWQQPSLPELARLRDVVAAGALILLFLPLMLLVAIVIKCDSRGPILLWEQRVGPTGCRFRARRFRITVVDGCVCEQARLTFVGDLIRRFRIDALPQLVNVLHGEMTCVPCNPQRLFFLD